MISTITQNGGIQHYKTVELEQKLITDYLHRLSIVVVNITLQIEVKEIKT